MRKIWCVVLMLLVAFTAVAGAEASDDVYLTADFMDTAELVSMQSPGDGTYMEVWLVDEAAEVTICMQPAGYYDAESFAQLISDEARNIYTGEDILVAGRVAKYVTYFSGSGDDERRCLLACFDEGALSIAVLISVPSKLAEQYSARIENWLASITLGYINADQGFTWDAAEAFAKLFKTSEMDTVGEIIAAYQPERFFWMTDDENATLLDMSVKGGTLAVKLRGASELLTDDIDFEGETSIHSDVYPLACEFQYAVWDSQEFPLAPIAGIRVGDSRASVLATLPGAEIYPPAPEYEDFSETIEYIAFNGDAYYMLDYYIENDAVTCIMLQYFAE